MKFNGQRIRTVRIEPRDLKRFRRLAKSSRPGCEVSALIERGLQEHNAPLVITGPGGVYLSNWPRGHAKE